MTETRKLAAILVADIVGYSRLAGADEDRILARLRTLRSDLIDPILAVHHGRVVKRTSDGAIVEFRSVVDAVCCAIEVQSGLAERNAGLPPEKRIEYRVGIHLGDVVEEEDGDLMGDGVNIAARLEGVARPGTICLSEDAYRQVSGRLEMSVTDLGPTKLKNIDKSVRAYLLEVGKSMQPRQGKCLLAKWRLVSIPLAALLLVGVASGWYILGGRLTKPTAGHLSVVVLPFANLSGDPAQDYLADALTNELTTGIARFPNSFVIANKTASTYKGKPVDAKSIGKELGVRYVLEGSVQPSSDQLRVDAQLIDADSGAHVWAEQFDTAARTDLLKMQDEVVTHLARAMFLQLPEAEAARLKRTPAANPNAEDLALQCTGAVQRASYIGKEADAGYRLCEQALAADPNNIRALHFLSVKFFLPVALGLSADPKGDLKRADELLSRALALDPDYAPAHMNHGTILLIQGHPVEAIAEHERALALDPALVDAHALLGFDHLNLGQFEKSVEYFDKAIRLSPRDPYLSGWHEGKAQAYFGLKDYDQAIDSARQSVAINPNFAQAHRDLIAALALTGHDTEAREALQRYLALPPTGQRTISAWKEYKAQISGPQTDAHYLET
jgi:TolB-like protein/class 3 adenylate cyclase/cytochrome c-type biogenesis protein CcmH/NrfG